MKPFSVHSTSCSCTSCVYRSRSKEHKVQQIIQDGTEIDKLFYGKFLPLRERKLLEKLIRTRDVYDDVRNQLLSSASSIQTSVEQKRKRRDDVSIDKRSAVLKMVDLVDKGQTRSANTSKLGSCCSCCSCETLRKIRKRMEKESHKHPRVHRQIVTCEDIAKYCAAAEERGRKRRNKLSTKISSKVGSARLKLKKNLSEPCACFTLSLSSMATRSSKAIKKNLSKKNFRKVATIDQETKITKLPKKPRRHVKNIQSNSTKDSGTEMRSLKAFKIKKDSILLFREKLLKKRTYADNQDVECEPGTCNTRECIPEECLRRIKSKGVGDTRKRKYYTRHSETGRDRSHISMRSQANNLKVRDSQAQVGSSSKSSHSMTTLHITNLMPPLSKSEIKGKRPVLPNQRKHIEKRTGKQDKAYKITKSATSMMSIPKSKAKAQLTIKEEKFATKVKPKVKLRVLAKDKRLEEKGIRVQVSPQSNLATCECKLSTKSTSSLTSVPKQKASKSRFKSIKSHEVASPPTRHKRDRQKPRRELRSKSRGKSAITGLDHLRRKSVRSAAFSQEISSRSRTNSKHKQSKSAENVISKPKNVSKESTEIVEKSSPDRQAVKITSTFSFDIEFYKDTYPSVKDDEKKDLVSGHENKIKQKEHRRKYKDHGTGYISSRQNISSQSKSSQSFKNIKVGYRLKRCFCTLKLLPKQKQKLKHAVSKKTMTSFRNKEFDVGPRKKQTQTKLSGIAYVAPPATSAQASLLPYECEPIFCTPGDCNTYDCTEKIKQRNRRAASHVSKDTNTTVTPKKSKFAFTSQSVSKSTSIPKHSCGCVPQSSNVECECKVSGGKSERHKNRIIQHKGRHTPSSYVESKVLGGKSERRINRTIKNKRRYSPSSNVESKVSVEISERQTVRIGSNFNFNIEFSKTNTNDLEKADSFKFDRSIKKERRHLQEKGTKVHKPHVRHNISETNKYVKTKQTHTEPFLQRCLCTLKLMKKNKKKVETISPWKDRNEYIMHMQKKSVTTNRAEISYNAERSKILPKECDPYTCKKLIKLRHMLLQDKYSNVFSGDLGSRPTFSKTSRTVSSKSRSTQSISKECPKEVKERNEDYNEINIMLNHSKQRVMRVGSKSSLKLSRYKSKDNFITTDDLINKHTRNKYKLNTIGSQKFKRPVQYTSIDAEAKRKEKGSYVFSAIKRCFSTFKFPKKRNKAGLSENNDVTSESIKNSYPVPNSQLCEYKITRTRLSKLPYGLRSYKCAPNFWNPPIYDPYQCYEESEQHEVKGLHDHYVCTDRREIKSVMSVTTSDFSGSTMTKSKSRLLKRNTKKDQKVRDKQRGIKASRSFPPSRQAAHKLSNFSFNKEMSKYRFVPSIRDTTIEKRVEKYNAVSKISAVSRMPGIGTKHNRVALKPDLSQANQIRKEVKASNVGFLLKRCFCTLGLQKKNKPKPTFHWHQPITTQFVEVEQNRHETKPKCKVLNKTLYVGEPVKLKLPEGDHFLRKNLFANQSATYLPNSRSLSRRAHVRSSMEFNFDKMRCLLSTQKINPFYRSFYALNVKVSKSKNIPHYKYRAFDGNERKPDECPPNECDPVDCSKKVKRLKRSKVSDTTSQISEFSCYKKCKAEKRKKGEDKPVTFGSDLSIRAGVYKDTDPYKSPRCQALRLGSDVRVNFDFFKEPPSRGFCRTGPIPYYDRKEARRSHTGPADLQTYGETQSKVTGISHMIKKCFCASKLKNATKSDINQNRDVTRTVKDNPRYKSTTRLSLRREKRERSLEAKSIQYEDILQQQSKKSHRPTDRNNVTFCTNVNCVEFYNDRTQKQTKLNRIQGRGEGDVGKQKGPIEEKKTVIDKCLCAFKKSKKPQSEKNDKNKNLNKFIDKCYCTIKHLKGQRKGTNLTPKQSMEIIGKGNKKCKQLEEAQRAMETIMPYSKKKFKKLDSQSKFTQGTNPNTNQNQQLVCPFCKTKCQPINPDSMKIIKKLDDRSKLAPGTNQNTKQYPQGICEKCMKRNRKSAIGFLNTCFCPKHMDTIEYLSYEDAHRKVQCPVCIAIATGTFSKTNNKLPCTCKDKKLEKKKSGGKRKTEPKPPVVAKTKDQFLGNKKSGGKLKKEPKLAVVDQTPLFEMTVNKTNMRILNKDEVLQHLGSSGKESKAMKKARAAIKKGNVDAPVMELRIDRNASIINSEQVLQEINSPNMMKKGKNIKAGKIAKALKPATKPAVKSHGSKCKCCICRGLKKGKKTPGAQLSMQPQKLRPCVCGSVLCKKDWDKIYHEQRSQAAVKLKKCVCGSNICAEESSKMPELLLEGARQAEREKEMARQAVIKEKLYQTSRKKRAKEQEKARKKENKIRKKQDKREMKLINKSENQGDISLIAESLIDLGTFGSKAFCDIARCMCRAVRYPRDAFGDVREAISDPAAAATALKARAESVGLFATLSRIKQRMLRMPTAKAAVTTLEAYPTTNYLVHMADKDPKKRMKKFKAKRTREPLDFQCSVYMASMRKRPCLRVYYMCPWFYPHCMSLLNLWKQFMDILLFLLAVAVWSPCILCMELCRGCVCCCMCQG